MLKTNSVEGSGILSKSKIFSVKEFIQTELPIINIAFSGSLDGGLIPGMTVFAAPSKHFKSLISLCCMKAFLDKFKDGIAVLYDSEYGITPEYLKSNGIDPERVVHVPVDNVEQLKFDVVKKLEAVDGKKDKLFIMIDSIGNLASKKEVEDAENEHSVADMSRAKAIKSLFRIITPHLTKKGIPCVVINHVYANIGDKYNPYTMSGGCLEAGSEIIMADGSLKNIEEVALGDTVRTLDGQANVLHTWNPDTLKEGEPECYRVTFDDCHSVVCSGHHRFKVGDHWLKITQIDENTCVDHINSEMSSLAIKSIEKVGKRKVYDIEVENDHHYILKNGVASHNSGIIYSANQIFTITKATNKGDDGIEGFRFTLVAEKSRYVKEKAKFPFTVTFADGIQKWSTMFDLALEFGAVNKPGVGWYEIIDQDTGEVVGPKRRAKDVESDNAFFEKLVKNTKFKQFVENKYKIGGSGVYSPSEIEQSQVEEDMEDDE